MSVKTLMAIIGAVFITFVLHKFASSCSSLRIKKLVSLNGSVFLFDRLILLHDLESHLIYRRRIYSKPEKQLPFISYNFKHKPLKERFELKLQGN